MVEAKPFDIVKIKEGVRENIPDTIVKETPLTISLNGHEFATLFCTCDKPKYLAVGFLNSEGLIRGKDDIRPIRVNSNRSVVRVNSKSNKDIPFRGLTLKRFTSSGGKGASWYCTQESIESEKKICPTLIRDKQLN